MCTRDQGRGAAQARAWAAAHRLLCRLAPLCCAALRPLPIPPHYCIPTPLAAIPIGRSTTTVFKLKSMTATWQMRHKMKSTLQADATLVPLPAPLAPPLFPPFLPP